MEWALAHPYLTTLLGLAAMLLAFIVTDYIFTAVKIYFQVRLAERASE